MQMSKDWSTGRKLTQTNDLVALFACYIYLMSTKHHLHDRPSLPFATLLLSCISIINANGRGKMGEDLARGYEENSNKLSLKRPLLTWSLHSHWSHGTWQTLWRCTLSSLAMRHSLHAVWLCGINKKGSINKYKHT